MSHNAKAFWAKVLMETPLHIRRRASAYLKRVKRTSEVSWLVWSKEGSQYNVRLEKGSLTCSCPFDKRERGYCKHICAVAVHELVRREVRPWLRRLEQKL